jgi:hypothetical protein
MVGKKKKYSIGDVLVSVVYLKGIHSFKLHLEILHIVLKGNIVIMP